MEKAWAPQTLKTEGGGSNKPILNIWDILNLFYFIITPIFLSIQVNIYPKYKSFKLLKSNKEGKSLPVIPLPRDIRLNCM